MKCKKIEELLLRSFDGRLDVGQKNELEVHLRGCPRCQKRGKEYGLLLEALQKDRIQDPLPFFEERVRARIREKLEGNLWPVWREWSFRLIPAALILIIALTAALIFELPKRPEALSPSEILLLQNENPLWEAKNLLEGKKLEDQSLGLIFTAVEENSSLRGERS